MEIIKPLIDNKTYKYTVLPNKLQTLIISDPTSPTCSAALLVNVGYNCDPEGIPGLAHFLEHMLFMGTKKYPDENAFFELMNRCGGSTNAMTTDEFTLFHFDIQKEYFEEALNMFSHFFIDPLFKADMVSREMYAVDSEHSKNKNSDYLRLDLILKSLISPSHPYAHYGGGNLETLNIKNIREDLVKFYSTHYSANVMKLVVYSDTDVDSTEQLAHRLFSPVVNKHVTVPVFPKPFDMGVGVCSNSGTSDSSVGDTRNIKNINTKNPQKPQNPQNTKNPKIQCSKLIKFVPVADRQKLHIFWQLPSMRKTYFKKPVEYIMSLLGHRGEGTLVYGLIQEGLCIDISVSKYLDTLSFMLVEMELTLTKIGFQQIPYIIDQTYKYIDLLNHKGIKPLYYDELKKTSQLNFDFMEKTEPSSYVTSLATNMLFSSPPEYIIYAPYYFKNYSEQVKNTLADTLNWFQRSNSIVAISSKFYNDKVHDAERWYGTKFDVLTDPVGFGDEFIPFPSSSLPSSSPLSSPSLSLSLPTKNIYIVDKVKILPKQPKPERTKYPQKITVGPIELWFKKDNTFNAPNVMINICILTNKLYESARTLLAFHIFTKILDNKLSSDAYYASLGNSVISVDIVDTYVLIFVDSYYANVSLLMEKIISTMLHSEISDEEYKIAKANVSSDLHNVIYQQLSKLAVDYLKEKTYNLYYTVKDLTGSLPTVDISDVRKVGATLMGNCFIKAHIQGNLTKQDAVRIIEYVNTKLTCSTENPYKTIMINKLTELTDGEEELYLRYPINSSEADSVINIFYEVGNIKKGVSTDWDKKLCLLYLVNTLTTERFFNTLRTVEQVAYIVRSTITQIGDFRYPLVGLSFLIQTARKDPAFLRSRIKKFIDATAETIQKMSNDEFQDYKKSMRIDILKKPNNLTSEFKDNFNEIIKEEYVFDNKYRIVAVLEKIQKQDVVDFYARYFVNSNTRKVRIVEIYNSVQLESLFSGAGVGAGVGARGSGSGSASTGSGGSNGSKGKTSNHKKLKK